MCYRFRNDHRWGTHHPRFHRKLHKMRRFGGGWNYPPANVQEYDDKYELFIYAPGLTKEAFQIAVVDNILIIKTDPDAAKPAEEQENWRRREFTPGGFKRRFELTEGINTEAISAKYEDGVLQLTLPKLDDFHTKRKDVPVD